MHLVFYFNHWTQTVCTVFVAGGDYTINIDDLTVSFPAGPSGMVRCVPFTIIDDNIAFEENETFQFDISPGFDMVLRDPYSAVVTIFENDLGKVHDPIKLFILYLTFPSTYQVVHGDHAMIIPI